MLSNKDTKRERECVCERESEREKKKRRAQTEDTTCNGRKERTKRRGCGKERVQCRRIGDRMVDGRMDGKKG
jgi:hypothetical protein